MRAGPARRQLLSALVLALCLVVGLSACGFQLRGEARLPASMAQTRLVTPDQTSAFVRELERLLVANGVELVQTAEGRAAELRITREAMRREALTIAGDARVREFVLIFEVGLGVLDADGEPLMEVETLRLTRDYSFDEQEILAATREEEFLRADLRRSMASRVMRRLEGLGRQ